MTILELIDNYPVHDSIRGAFAFELFKAMAADDRIWLILPDLGFGMFDLHLEHFPDRVKQIGASEQCAVGVAVGLALSGKIPIVYSITTFLIYRPFEWIRNYLNHEQIPVLLVGSGRDKDYVHDGITHQPLELYDVLSLWPNIRTYWPVNNQFAGDMLKWMISGNKPAFMCLRR